MSDIADSPNQDQPQQPKKVSLAEAAKQKLAQKKQAQANANAQQKYQPSGNQRMKSQQTKKTTNTSRKMGV